MGLDTVELVIRFEESLGISMPDSAAQRMSTPSDVIDYAMVELQAQGQTPIRCHVAEIVRLLTLDQSGMRANQYREDGRFVEDFGMD
jgi:hypothetical protein